MAARDAVKCVPKITLNHSPSSAKCATLFKEVSELDQAMMSPNSMPLRLTPVSLTTCSAEADPALAANI